MSRARLRLPRDSKLGFRQVGTILTVKMFGLRQELGNLDSDVSGAEIAGGLGGIGTALRRRSPPALTTIFHEKWWLDAAAGANLCEASVEENGKIVGWLPFVSTKVRSFTMVQMPPFTHLLGPVVTSGRGKPQSQFLRQKKIIRELASQLPRCDHFRQHMPSFDSYGLAFQECGFRITPQYTFSIDCRESLTSIWDGMHHKVRQHIRRAESRNKVESVDNPSEFIEFYLKNLARLRRRNREDFKVFPRLLAACRQRQSGELLCARGQNGEPAAMVFLVWGHGVMYYLLSTRTPEAAHSGSVSLLVWAAIQRAHAKGLTFDLDGVTTKGTAQFLSGFGGEIATRLVVQRSAALFGAAQWVKERFAVDDRSLIFS